jgi:uncharacterized membrane protein
MSCKAKTLACKETNNWIKLGFFLNKLIYVLVSLTNEEDLLSSISPIN